MVSGLRDGGGQGQPEGLEGDLRDRVDGEVRFDAGTRGAYWTDASNFRQVPVGVVLPRTPDAAVEAVAVCREHEVPVLSRGGGTSLAGQATNAAVVLDWSKYCHRIESVDEQERTCIVEPGIVLDVLNEHLSGRSLRFGPEPATHMNCTLGGGREAMHLAELLAAAGDLPAERPETAAPRPAAPGRAAALAVTAGILAAAAAGAVAAVRAARR